MPVLPHRSPADDFALTARTAARRVMRSYSTSFALTARRTGIGPAQWEPFFASMRSDIPATPHPEDPTVLSPDQLAAYIHGSAEVVGEMCVLAFFDGAPLPADAEHRLLPGARALGSAFQKVNFLRDIAHDSARLKRGSVAAPGQAQSGFTTRDRDRSRPTTTSTEGDSA